MVSSRRSQSSNGNNNGLGTNAKDHTATYEKIMGQEGGHSALTNRLVTFRKWIQNAGCQVHSAVCIVNGEATDGTKNAPVLVLGPPPTMATSSVMSSAELKSTGALSASVTGTTAPTAISALAASKPVSGTEGRCGLVDKEEDRMLYDRTIGCQIRTTREMKEGQVMMTVPRTVMIHPDLIAGSDMGRIALACCEPLKGDKSNFWDVFGHTATIQETHLNKVSSSGGTQLLVKILQERKKAETILAKAAKAVDEGNIGDYSLASKGTISARAVYLLFLIQQRFSDEVEPRVSSDCDDFRQYSIMDDASTHMERIGLAPGTPDTFAPYARTLPPSVPLPMCWKRNELATLASCIPGLPLMQEIAAQIMTFSSDLIALVEAGILYRFPSIISPKLLTWDRWIWAGSVHMSRALPSMCYLNRGENSPKNHIVAPGEMFYSPPHVWKDLGVMVPLVDMLNHEAQESQIKWMSPKAHVNDEADKEDDEMGTDGKVDDVAKILIQKRVKKGSQIYTTYNIECNQNLILQYGFAQMANDSDSVQIGWALQDGVGQCSKPSDYVSIDQDDSNGLTSNEFVYESLDLDTVNSWWTEDRLKVLQKAMTADANFWKNLRNGKKMVSAAYSDGTYEPKLLTALVVATMSPGDVKKFLATSSASNGNEKLTMTKRHQRILRHYMLFLFSRKLERLLQNIGNGLKAHFNNFELWTKVTEGGLDYSGGNRGQNTNSDIETSERTLKYIGWNSFFDAFAYSASMEIETRYYALAPESCVLTLYDGHLRALQKSINGVATEHEFQKCVAPALQDLDFILSNNEKQNDEFQHLDEKLGNLSDCHNKKDDKIGIAEKAEKKKPSSQRQNKKVSQPSIKLHIGNLSYQTTPASLSNYFASRYGRENVLECHIPTERDTGKSRGFGFITLVESFALKVLHENLSHNIDGRVVKIAESNTSIQARGGQIGNVPEVVNERCSKCGYRPKYCTCSLAGNAPTFQNRGDTSLPIQPYPSQSHSSNGPYGPRSGGPNPLTRDQDSRGYDRETESRAVYDDRRRGRSFRRDRSNSQSPPPNHRQHRDVRSYGGDYNYGKRRSLSSSRYGNNYGRSRSRSMSIEETEGQEEVIATRKVVEEAEKVEVQENPRDTTAVAAEVSIAATAQVCHGMFLEEKDTEHAKYQIIINLIATTQIFRVKVKEVEVEVMLYKVKIWKKISWI
eukprot:CAMPEP_0176505242 /NCGR_PEP_ID=MMETSP0200_2-20121128/16388_1 /TAXON_ID=947934 /ORGANISM="Chaetoceros sp., Strain GSL56" /LENGTH=1194 /DNA_ID=CAMNT_0017904779 /DNA_START=357 /DNA_END=3942 /DNA_ORIENTATION=-